MYKFVIFCAVLWHGIWEISGQVGVAMTDTATPTFPSIDLPKINESGKHVQLDGNHNYYATQQIFYFGGAFGRPNFNNIGKEFNADYLVTNGIGAHKLHRRKLSWSKAREICVQEGGHLAIIRTESEEKIVLQMMVENSFDDAWLGLHDRFEEGNWISVLDEPLAKTGWARWSDKFPINPDNYQGKQHCARIVKTGGMDDDNCDLAKPFVCKISTF